MPLRGLYPQNNYLLRTSVLLVLLGALLPSCSRPGDSDFRLGILESERSKRRPSPLEIRNPEKAPMSATIGDLRIDFPERWRLCIHKDCQMEDSQYWHAWFARLDIIREGGDIKIDIGYMQGKTFLCDIPQDIMRVMHRASPNPQGVLKSYKTDLELFDAACTVVPEDYRLSHGKAREKAKVLLYMKYYRMFVDKRFAFGGARGFLAFNGGDEQRRYAVDLFDLQGKFRGSLDVCFPDNFPQDEALQLVAQVLYGCKFQ